MDREDLERLTLEEFALSADEEVAAEARRRLDEEERDEDLFRHARERRGR